MYKRTQCALALACCGAVIAGCALAAKEPGSPAVYFLSKTYRLASFHQTSNPMWEFVTSGETIDAWTTLLTIVDRPDTHTRADLVKLTDGMKADYVSHGGQIIVARPVSDATGEYNYMVAGFDDPSKKLYELRFVKAALVTNNDAYVAVYSVRITDPQDYKLKAKHFVDQHSGDIGQALAHAELPNMKRLPRREF